MPVVQYKIGTKASNSANHTVVFDSAPIEGNLIVAFIHHRNTTTASDITLSGWTQSNVQINSAVQKSFWKIAGASESATVTIDTNSVSASGVMIIIELDDIDATGTLNDSGDGTSAGTSEVTSFNIPDATTTEATTQILAFVGVRNGGDTASFSADDSFTIQTDGESTGASPSGGGLAYRRVTSTGNYGPTVSWTDNGRCCGVVLAFKEAVAGGLTVTFTTPTFNWTENDLATAYAKVVTFTTPLFKWASYDIATSFAYVNELTAATMNWTANSLTTVYAYVNTLTAAVFNWTAHAITVTTGNFFILTPDVFNWTSYNLAITITKAIDFTAPAFNWLAHDITRTGAAPLIASAISKAKRFYTRFRQKNNLS